MTETTSTTTSTRNQYPRWVSVPEAAETLGVNAATLYRLARQNRVPHIRVGRTVRVNLTALEEFLSHGQVEVA